MNFLALIITLLLQQFWGSGERVQQDDWLRRWQGRVASWNVGPLASLVMVMLPALLAAKVLLNALQPALFGLLWIVVAVTLLLYALGRGDFHQMMERYRSQARAGDFEGAYLGTLADLGGTGELENPESLEAVHGLIQRGFFYEGYQRWFAVVFYFALLGPVGALAYRLLQLCRHNGEGELAQYCIFLADWVPARLLAATFTLTGDFIASRTALLNSFGDLAAPPAQLLYDVGTAALGAPDVPTSDAQSFSEVAARENEAMGKLLSRSAAGWVVLITLLVLLS